MTNSFTEDDLRVALNKALVKLYKEKLINKPDIERLITQKLILGLISDVLKNLGLDYKNGG